MVPSGRRRSLVGSNVVGRQLRRSRLFQSKLDEQKRFQYPKMMNRNFSLSIFTLFETFLLCVAIWLYVFRGAEVLSA